MRRTDSPGEQRTYTKMKYAALSAVSCMLGDLRGGVYEKGFAVQRRFDAQILKT